MSASESQFPSSDSQPNSQSDLQLSSQTDSSISPQSSSIPFRIKKPWIWTLVALSLMTDGITAWRWIAPTSGAAQPAQSPQAPPRAVEVAKLSSGTGVRQIELLGQVESTAQATVRAQTNGVIQQVLVL